MNRLTMFYIEHKDILKLKLSGKTSPYALPTFPKEGFLEGGDPLFQDSPQLALNILGICYMFFKTFSVRKISQEAIPLISN